MRRTIRAFASLSLCALAFLLSAQQPPANTTPPPPAQPPQADQQLPTFTADAPEVIVPVSVTDDLGRFVSDLKVSDFRILDEERPQRIISFSHDSEKQPVIMGILVELSNRNKTHWDKFKETIKDLILALLPYGKQNHFGYLVTYSSGVDLVMNTTQDGDLMAEKVDRMKPGGGSALYDAIYMACTSHKSVAGEPYNPRRVLIVIGDGHDSASKRTQAEALEIAKRYQTTIYGISTMAYGFASGDEGILEKLTGETGGKVEYPLSNQRMYKDVAGYLSVPRDAGNYVYEPGTGGYAAAVARGIVDSITAIQGEITTQYVLIYRPDVDPEETPKTFRHIRVEVPSLPFVKIRYRDGYYPKGAAAGK